MTLYYRTYHSGGWATSYYWQNDHTYDMEEHNVNVFQNEEEHDDSGDYEWINQFLRKHYKYDFYAQVVGTQEDDWIEGSEMADDILGHGGNDTIFGEREVDQGGLRIEPDNRDVLKDTIEGGPGHDSIMGGFGDDSINGGLGNDTIYGQDDDDYLGGRQDEDVIFGGSGNDEISGGEHNDQLYGDDGNDNIFGGNGDDNIFGGNGDDTLEGGLGNDVLFTGDLSNGESDVLYGGEGIDTFILGEIENGTVIPGQVDWAEVASQVGQAAGMMAAFSNPVTATMAKMAIYYGPYVSNIIEEINEGKTDTVVPPDSGAYAQVQDFNPREDVIIVPVSNGIPNVFVDSSNTGLRFEYDDAGGVDAFAVAHFADDFLDDGTSLKTGARTKLAEQLMNNALVVDSTGVYLDSRSIAVDNNGDATQNPDYLNIDVDLSSLGDNKYYIFGAFGPQTLEGISGTDYLYGTNYDDILSGYQLESGGGVSNFPVNAGIDELYGFDGNDIFLGGKSGSGVDAFYGGEGIDYASYVDSTAGINANLATVETDINGDKYLSVNDDGFGTEDRLYSVENIIGSPHDDTVSFNDTNSTSDAAVEVKVYSSEGTQTPGEGEINVLMEVENIIGSDSSNDTIDFSNLDGPLMITANSDEATTIVDTSTEQTYTVTDFETIIVDSVSGELIPSGQVTLEGLTFENATIETGNIMGTGGDDELEGSYFNDFISGGSGADTLTGGKGADIFYFSGGSGIKTITDFEPSEDIILVDSSKYQVSDTRNIIYSQDGDNLSLKISGQIKAIIEDVDVNEISNSDITYFTSSLPEWMTSQEIEVNSAPVTFSGDIRPGHDTIGTLPAQVVDTGIDNLTVGSGGWTSFDKYPRAIGDINNDGYDDIVGFGGIKVFTALSNGDGTFANVQTGIQGDFTYSGKESSLGKAWTSQDEYPRVMGDIDGDGNDDIVGFHEDTVYSSLSNGDGTFTTPQVAYEHGTAFTHRSGWGSDDKNPRTLGDVNGDGYDDIIGFANRAVRVALANGDGTFGEVYTALEDFSYGDGYTSQDENPRMVGDLNGDGFDDILAISDSKLNVAFGRTNGNGTFFLASQSYAQFSGSRHHWMSPNQGWDSQNTSPRMLADINGDGKDDLIGFNPDDNQIYVSYYKRDMLTAQGPTSPKIIVPQNGFEEPVALTNITGTPNIGQFSNQNQYPRMVGDITGNGQDDILAFNHDDIFAAEWL